MKARLFESMVVDIGLAGGLLNAEMINTGSLITEFQGAYLLLVFSL